MRSSMSACCTSSGALTLAASAGARRVAIERHAGIEVGQRGRQLVHDAAAPAEADRAQLAVGVGARSQPAAAATKSSRVLRLVQLGEGVARLVFVARIAAQRRQRVGREGHEAVEREAARDVLDVRIEAAVLVDHQHRRQPGVRRRLAAAPGSP